MALRQSQRVWIAMLTATCDFAHQSDGDATARRTFHASCLRDLVFARQLVFWRVRTEGTGRIRDPAEADLHYEGEVVPFAFRPPDP